MAKLDLQALYKKHRKSVRSLSYEEAELLMEAELRGGLFPGEGGRIQVRYQATFSTLDNSAEGSEASMVSAGAQPVCSAYPIRPTAIMAKPIGT